MDFAVVKNEVLIFDFALRKKSIDEIFKSHIDFTALNPIWRLKDSITEFTALPATNMTCYNNKSLRIHDMLECCDAIN